MGGLFSALQSGSQALKAYTKALDITQNNVSNASTPGYVKQSPDLEANPFNLPAGLTGGVTAGNPISSRDEYLEQAVRAQEELSGNYSAQSQTLSSIQNIFDVSGQSGVDGALNNLLQSFSAWSASPEDPGARQDVLAKAQDVASSFQQAAAALASATTSADSQISSTVQQINSLAAQLQGFNKQILQSPSPDAGLDAQVHATMEQLSGLANVTARFESDGTVTVLLGGQTPLVIGTTLNSIRTGSSAGAAPVNPNATPATTILDASGGDVTSQVTSGTLGGLLNVRNTVLPSLQGDGQQAGALNQLAKQFADRVNQILQSGQTSSGASGTPLFSYDPSSNADVARTLTLNPNATADSLAAVSPGPPVVSNGTALTLSNLGTSTAAQDTINGQTILNFYSSTAAQVGRLAQSAQNNADSATQALNQAQSFRDSVSGISLDEEATRVIELQRGYQAASQLISVVNTLTDSLINMMG